MVNHVHVILRTRPDVVAGWSDEDVAKRWWQLFPHRKNKDKTPAVPTESELKLFMTPVRCKQLRSRLSDISWWMRALAEPIARRSNFDDKCSGRFWEGRFKCQKLADAMPSKTGKRASDKGFLGMSFELYLKKFAVGRCGLEIHWRTSCVESTLVKSDAIASLLYRGNYSSIFA
jgi:hypothetical protein